MGAGVKKWNKKTLEEESGEISGRGIMQGTGGVDRLGNSADGIRGTGWGADGVSGNAAAVVEGWGGARWRKSVMMAAGAVGKGVRPR